METYVQIPGRCALFRIQIWLTQQKNKDIVRVRAMATKEKPTSQAVSFTVDFDEPKKKPKRIPKNLSSERLQKRQELSRESLAEKQRQAEERRKVSERPHVLKRNYLTNASLSFVLNRN